jgi:tRNA(Ile2) C34 agmatinyltransferase TiaS
MTGAVLDRPGTQRFELEGGLTLEELLNATLQSARATGSTECPVCHARMASTRAGAECGGCGSRLS